MHLDNVLWYSYIPGHFLLLVFTKDVNLSAVYHLVSPWFSQSDGSCYLEAMLHMRNMQDGSFKLVMHTKNHSSWVPLAQLGNDKNMWVSKFTLTPAYALWLLLYAILTGFPLKYDTFLVHTTCVWHANGLSLNNCAFIHSVLHRLRVISCESCILHFWIAVVSPSIPYWNWCSYMIQPWHVEKVLDSLSLKINPLRYFGSALNGA